MSFLSTGDWTDRGPVNSADQLFGCERRSGVSGPPSRNAAKEDKKEDEVELPCT